MKDALISREDLRKLHPVFRGKYGDKIIDFGVKISALHVPNEIYNRSKHLTGPAFCKDVLDNLGIIRTIKNLEILDNCKGSPFITVSNHAYGHIDGIAAIETVGSHVENYKMMVNVILGLIDTMAENFITVNPMKYAEKNSITYAGIRESISHVRKGYPLGFFPAGAVSNMVFKNGKIVIEDREWQPAVLKIIQKVKVPVIPMHISGRNSLSFYFSRIFGWKVRNLRLCHEMYNKKGKEIVITFGEPITPDIIELFEDDTKSLGEFLKAKTYALGKK
ncbi:MAG: 1-acyl-sn-glycerol-3-phosphate acyltransferase [Proteiniphilum sp.]|nr:1-acyl-sn-glycerol-3-phosphate acyltransferase [Proteiniphilum sp.]MDD3908418.1 1-acyl-sn-glycerol-3-phosphate acyltransferase [Proteiniphilum sp.]MDD4415626.1 1-acyl-sn-glycerol-3-phosphate acyltransferase [Proteiniphilum sp.]